MILSVLTKNIRNMIYIVFIVVGALEFVFLFMFRFVLDLAAGRQASRIRIRLFETLVQRVCHSLICVHMLMNAKNLFFF
jgi:hypothetical protein